MRSLPAEARLIASGDVGESTRNPRLRRVDWRFLLPDPRPARTLCLCDGELRDAVRLISDSVVFVDATEPASFDLVVDAGASEETLAAAARAVVPGGHLYVEDARCLGRSESAVGRRLAESGFRLVGLWMPQPRIGRGTAEQWVPLDATAARFAMRYRPTPTAVGALRRRALEAAWLRVPAVRYQVPFCALAERIAAAAPPSGGRPSSETPIANGSGDGGVFSTGTAITVRPGDGPGASLDLGETLRLGWRDWGLGPTPGKVSVVLMTGGRRSVNKVAALGFADNEFDPRIVVKMPRVSESIAGLEREATTLRALQERQPPVPGVPRILFQTHRGNTPCIGQSFMRGRRLSEVFTRQSLPELARKVAGWQITLAGEPTGWSQPELHRSIIEPAIADFRAAFGSVADPAMLEDAIAAIRRLDALPVVCEQRDFSPWNLLITPDGSIAVLDWESSVVEGVPALDLIYFFTYASVYLERAFDTGDYSSAYRAMLGGGAGYEDLAVYAAGLSLAPEQLRALRILTWMVHSRSTRGHLEADRPGAEQPREVLRRMPFMQFWETEMQEGK
jgi:aminoglycoside phosphotransferase (APT) family kinase protein